MVRGEGEAAGGVCVCELNRLYLHASEGTRFAKRWSAAHPGRRARRVRRAAGKGALGEKGVYPGCWPERSP